MVYIYGIIDTELLPGTTSVCIHIYGCASMCVYTRVCTWYVDMWIYAFLYRHTHSPIEDTRVQTNIAHHVIECIGA